MQASFAFVQQFDQQARIDNARLTAGRFRSEAERRADFRHVAPWSPSIVYLDVETRSRAIIGAVGASKYGQHPTTEILCLVYWRGGDHLRIWVQGEDVPTFLYEDTKLYAHNASFEIAIFRHVLTRHGFPEIPLDRWECVAAIAAYANLPRGLDSVTKRLELAVRKDMSGRESMLAVATPQGSRKNPIRRENGEFVGGWFDENPRNHEKVGVYCGGDVIATAHAHQALPQLPAFERKVWLLDQEINRAGVAIDVPMCRGARRIIEEERIRANSRLAEITDYKITTADQDERIKKYLLANGVPVPYKFNKKGKYVPSLDAEAVKDMLGYPESWMPDDCREILEIRQKLAFSAVDKYLSALVAVEEDGRCRYQILYHAAGPGRFGGKVVQFQNLKRGGGKHTYIDLITRGNYDEVYKASGGRPLDALAQSVRLLIKAPQGRKLIISDLTQIEARILAWLAGEEHLLELFIRREDIYIDMAARIYGIDPSEVTDDQRQMGKVAILGLGYGCGYQKFVSVAWAMGGVVINEETSREVVRIYRESYPKIRQYWYDLGRAAADSIRNRAKVHVGCVYFDMWRRWLTCTLPSGRSLHYFDPIVTAGDRGPEIRYLDGKHDKNADSDGYTRTHGPKLTENIDQAIGRDILCEALLRIRDRVPGFTSLHIHDEVHTEVDTNDQTAKDTVHSCMCEVPSWAAGLPIAAKTHESERYNK